MRSLIYVFATLAAILVGPADKCGAAPASKLGVTFDGDQTARESYLGMSPTRSVNRVFQPWSKTSVGAEVAADLQAGRDVVLSLTAPPSSWAAIAAGSHDTKLKTYLKSYRAIQPVTGGPAVGMKYFAIQHEPEDNGGVEADYRKMQRRVRMLVDEVNNDTTITGSRISMGMILMAFTYTHGNAGRWWADFRDAAWTAHPSGRKYMEWIGSDAYNWAFTERHTRRKLCEGQPCGNGDPWLEFSALGQGTVDFANANANPDGTMPVFFTEVGCNEARDSLTWRSGANNVEPALSDPSGWNNKGGYPSLPRDQWRARWLLNATEWVREQPRVKMFLYFDQTYEHARGLSDPNVANPGTSEQNDATIAQWRAIVNHCHFGGTSGTCP